MKSLRVVSLLLLAFALFRCDSKNCTSEKKRAVCAETAVQSRVEWACQQIERDGKLALPAINEMRYDCCGEPNYVWVNDLQVKMVLHPIKSGLNGKNLTDQKDPSGKRLFSEFTAAVLREPQGSWVEYLWPKFGESAAEPKKSWVRKCKVGGTDDYWVVGSGTWK